MRPGSRCSPAPRLCGGGAWTPRDLTAPRHAWLPASGAPELVFSSFVFPGAGAGEGSGHRERRAHPPSPGSQHPTPGLPPRRASLAAGRPPSPPCQSLPSRGPWVQMLALSLRGCDFHPWAPWLCRKGKDRKSNLAGLGKRLLDFLTCFAGAGPGAGAS